VTACDRWEGPAAPLAPDMLVGSPSTFVGSLVWVLLSDKCPSLHARASPAASRPLNRPPKSVRSGACPPRSNNLKIKPQMRRSYGPSPSRFGARGSSSCCPRVQATPSRHELA